MPSTSAYLLVIQVLDWDRHNNVAGVKLVKEIPTPPLLIIGSPTTIKM
jgi:hypothetical protein